MLPHKGNVMTNNTSCKNIDNITADFDNMFGNLKNITHMSENGITISPVDCSLVLIRRGDLILGVSRKDNFNDIGLPGGKLERGETFTQAAMREATEETDLIIKLLPYPHYDGVYKGLSCRTFLAEIVGKVTQARDPSETGVVDFYDKQSFLDGGFGEYNLLMFKHFGV